MKKLLEYTSKLKHLPRTGWLRHGIDTPESVAAHSWQMGMMAIQLSNTKSTDSYDYNKVIKMCLCHDLGESIIGDITPQENAYKNKKMIEKQAIQQIAEQGNISELIDIFNEYEENITPEAQLANDLDKLDMYAQSLDYEKKYSDKDLEEFRQSARLSIKTKIGKDLLKELENR